MALRSLEGLRFSERQITHRFTEPAAQDQACKHLSQTGKELPQWIHGSLCGALASKQTQHSEEGRGCRSAAGVMISLRRCVLCQCCSCITQYKSAVNLSSADRVIICTFTQFTLSHGKKICACGALQLYISEVIIPECALVFGKCNLYLSVFYVLKLRGTCSTRVSFYETFVWFIWRSLLSPSTVFESFVTFTIQRITQSMKKLRLRIKYAWGT